MVRPHIDAAQTYGIIAVGCVLPQDSRIEIIMVGINCIEVVFNITNITISLSAVKLFSDSDFSFSISFIALIPSGVAALPSPSKFAVTLAEIAPNALPFRSRSGNSFESSGESSFAIVVLSPLLSAISVIPLHRQTVPVMVIINSTASDAEFNTEFVRLSVFPVITEQIILIIIIKHHIKFNIFTPKITIFLQKRLTFVNR